MEQRVTEEIVIDYKGREVKKSNAKLIKGKWYLRFTDCAVVDGVWYPAGAPELILDHARNCWADKRTARHMAHGLVAPSTWGYFTPNRDTNVLMGRKKGWKELIWTDGNALAHRNMGYTCTLGYPIATVISEEVALSSGLKESFANAVFYDPSELSASEKQCLFNIKGCPPAFMFKQLYNVEDDPRLREWVEKQFSEQTFLIGKETTKFYNKYLKDFTYGFELEYSNGFLRRPWMTNHGLIGLRDGSVSNTGSEVATIPIKSAKGLEALRDAMETMKERCEVDRSCSLHIHVGNVRKDKIYVISLWKLLYLLQDELFTMFPYERQAGHGDKVYCQRLPNLEIPLNIKGKDRDEYSKALNKSFNCIFSFLNKYPTGHFKSIKKVLVPKGDKYKLKVKHVAYSTKSTMHYQGGQPKWKVNCRYYFVSFYNLFFRKQETIEARIHEGTLNFDKSFNWMCTLVAILKYAERCSHVIQLRKISLDEIISWYFDERTAGILNDYWKLRKASLYSESEKSWKNSSSWMKGDQTYKNKETII